MDYYNGKASVATRRPRSHKNAGSGEARDNDGGVRGLVNIGNNSSREIQPFDGDDVVRGGGGSPRGCVIGNLPITLRSRDLPHLSPRCLNPPAPPPRLLPPHH